MSGVSYRRVTRKVRPGHFVLALLVLWLASIAPSAWAQACPDDDLDGYADCTVAGCDDTGLLCGDCDDSDGNVNPAEVEVCNHFDDDCNGLVDEGFAQPLTAQSVQDTVDGRPSDWFGVAVAGIGDVTGDGAERRQCSVVLGCGPFDRLSCGQSEPGQQRLPRELGFGDSGHDGRRCRGLPGGRQVGRRRGVQRGQRVAVFG
ncbi:MAG: putative metal-binding motif-containing protein [Planctomycetota bacterium]|jgi:hypothetical protein